MDIIMMEEASNVVLWSQELSIVLRVRKESIVYLGGALLCFRNAASVMCLG